MPNARATTIPIDTMTLKKLSVGEMVQVLGSTQEEANRILSNYL